MKLKKFFFKNGLCYIIKDELIKLRKIVKESYLFYDYRMTDENYKNEINCILKKYTRFVTDFEPILIEINEDELVGYDNVIKQKIEFFNRGKKNNETITKYFAINERLYNIFITKVLERSDKITDNELKGKVELDFSFNQDKQILEYYINSHIIPEEVKSFYDDFCSGKIFDVLKSINQKYNVVC